MEIGILGEWEEGDPLESARGLGDKTLSHLLEVTLAEKPNVGEREFKESTSSR